MAKAKKKPASNDLVELYEALVAAHPGMVRKGAANPYTAVNGNMYTLLHQSERLAIRLPEEQRAEFLKKYKTKLFEAYGTVMPEYVAVPEALLKKAKELEKWMGVSFAYARGLRPKATTKRSKTGEHLLVGGLGLGNQSSLRDEDLREPSRRKSAGLFPDVRTGHPATSVDYCPLRSLLVLAFMAASV